MTTITYISLRTEIKNKNIITTYKLQLFNTENDNFIITDITKKTALQIIKELNLTFDEKYNKYC